MGPLHLIAASALTGTPVAVSPNPTTSAIQFTGQLKKRVSAWGLDCPLLRLNRKIDTQPGCRTAAVAWSPRMQIRGSTARYRQSPSVAPSGFSGQSVRELSDNWFVCE